LSDRAGENTRDIKKAATLLTQRLKIYGKSNNPKLLIIIPLKAGVISKILQAKIRSFSNEKEYKNIEKI